MPDAPCHPAELAKAAARLRRGGLVAFPTETVFGLGADATSPAAVAALFHAKKRPANRPIAALVRRADDARQLVSLWPDRAADLAERFWPGPLTLILPRRDSTPANLAGGGSTLGVRCPDHPAALALLDAFGGPIAAASANRFGRLPPTQGRHVKAALAGFDALVLAPEARCPGGLESTVVDLSAEAREPGAMPCILRRGPLSSADLGLPAAAEPAQAPAPTGAVGPRVDRALRRAAEGVELALVLLRASEISPALDALAHAEKYIQDKRCGDRDRFGAALLCAAPSEAVLRCSSATALSHLAVFTLPAEPDALAAELYATLRQAVEAGARVALVEWPGAPGPLWDAVRDRLVRLEQDGE